MDRTARSNGAGDRDVLRRNRMELQAEVARGWLHFHPGGNLGIENKSDRLRRRDQVAQKFHPFGLDFADKDADAEDGAAK